MIRPGVGFSRGVKNFIWLVMVDGNLKKKNHHLSLFPLEIFIDSDCILMLRQSFLASNTFCSCNLEIIHHVFNTKYWQKTGKILIKCSSRCKVKVYDKNFYQS